MEKVKFNSGWKFWRETDPFELIANVPESAEAVTLPHDAMLCEAQREDSRNGGSTGFLDAGVYKYHKTFFVPEAWRGGRVILSFEGVYRHAAVFVNQSLAGSCDSGYREFLVEAQDYLRFGAENEVLVLVRCGTENSRWYSGAGIYRDVYLLHAPAVHIAPNGVRFSTEAVRDGGAAVEVSAEIVNDAVAAQTVEAQITVWEPDGAVAAQRRFPVRVRGNRSAVLRKRFFLENAKLWSEETPELYRVEVRVLAENGEEDGETVVTGIRKLSLDAAHGLLVNGKPVKLRGACLHHDAAILGAAAYDGYEYRRIRRLKDAGFNAVRSAHNHASQSLLRACDALGVYVMDELCDAWNKPKKHYDPSFGFEENWEKELEAMVSADFNHPSVILYSAGNEIFEIATERGIELSREIGERFHALDPSRYTTNGVNGVFAAGDGLQRIVRDITGRDVGKGDVNAFMGAMEHHMAEITVHEVLSRLLEKLEPTMDVLGYNYMTARYLRDAAAYPDRVMVGTETCPKQIAENWGVIESCPAVLGDFTWTGWDYMGEVPPAFPALFSTGGDISAIGVRRPASYYREIVFGLKKGPYIAVQDPKRFGTERNFGPWIFTDCVENYTWPGEEGRPVFIQVYAGGDEVELFQNGSSLGRKPCGRETGFAAEFTAEYLPGELTAAAYKNGVQIGCAALMTAGEPKELHVEKESFGGLTFLNLELRDGAGRRVFSGGEVSIELSGEVRLLGFGSETARHERGFFRPVTTLTDGCALAVLKAEGNVKAVVRAFGLATEIEL